MKPNQLSDTSTKSTAFSLPSPVTIGLFKDLGEASRVLYHCGESMRNVRYLHPHNNRIVVRTQAFECILCGEGKVQH